MGVRPHLSQKAVQGQKCGIYNLFDFQMPQISTFVAFIYFTVYEKFILSSRKKSSFCLVDLAVSNILRVFMAC